MKTRKRRTAAGARRAFAVCVRNDGHEASLERHKVYVVRPDAVAREDGDLRVVDESGEDYLYPADWFVLMPVPRRVRTSILKSS
jgi:hypothetical protein